MSAAFARFRAGLSRMEESPRVRACIFALLLALIGGTMFLLNAHTPLQMDDYDYSISWATGKPVSGLADVIASQRAHYALWGGRVVVHAIAQAFLWLGKPAFNAANTAMYLLLLLELYALARPKARRFCWPILMLAHGFLFFCVPFFGTVFLWLDGACNYLWGTALALLPLVMYKSAREGGAFARSAALGALAVPLSLLAGWTNENTACGVWAALFALLALDYLQGRRVRAWQWAALAAQAVGAALMILAPGNFARASAHEAAALLPELARRLASVTLYTAVYAGALLAALPPVLACARALGAKPRTGWALALLGAAELCAYAMVASPELSDRALTGVVALALCALMTAAADLDEGARAFDAAKLLALPMILLLLAYGGWQAVGDVRAHEAAWNAQLARAQQAALAGETRVALESVPSRSRFTMDIALAGDASAWPNSTLGKVLGVQVEGL